MAIRETLNKNPAIAVSVVVVALAAGVWYALSQIHNKPGKLEFYTADDGKTWFADEANKIVPYQKDGQDVVLAEVFQTPTHPPYVIYMRRLDAASLALVKSTYPNLQPGDPLPDIHIKGIPVRMEVKKPGDAKWRDIEANPVELGKYISLNSSDGSPLEEVDP
jgi:hypothetical protein